MNDITAKAAALIREHSATSQGRVMLAALHSAITAASAYLERFRLSSSGWIIATAADRRWIFETLVIGGPLDDKMKRYSTWEEAEAGHAAMVEQVRGASQSNGGRDAV